MLYRISRHRRSIGEFGIVFQDKRPLFLVVRGLPAAGQIAFNFRGAFTAIRFVLNQPLIRGIGDRPVVVIDGHGGIERLRIGSFADYQHIFGNGGLRSGQGKRQRNGYQSGAKKRV